MSTLDLYKTRQHTTVKLADPKTKEPIEIKLPNEYTVEEVERLLELQMKRESVETAEVADKGTEQLQEFWKIVFEQLTILVQHFQPDITTEMLRNMLTHKEALEIVGFYKTHRFQDNPENGKGKKKV